MGIFKMKSGSANFSSADNAVPLQIVIPTYTSLQGETHPIQHQSSNSRLGYEVKPTPARLQAVDTQLPPVGVDRHIFVQIAESQQQLPTTKFIYRRYNYKHQIGFATLVLLVIIALIIAIYFIVTGVGRTTSNTVDLQMNTTTSHLHDDESTTSLTITELWMNTASFTTFDASKPRLTSTQSCKPRLTSTQSSPRLSVTLDSSDASFHTSAANKLNSGAVQAEPTTRHFSIDDNDLANFTDVYFATSNASNRKTETTHVVDSDNQSMSTQYTTTNNYSKATERGDLSVNTSIYTGSTENTITQASSFAHSSSLPTRQLSTVTSTAIFYKNLTVHDLLIKSTSATIHQVNQSNSATSHDAIRNDSRPTEMTTQFRQSNFSILSLVVTTSATPSWTTGKGNLSSSVAMSLSTPGYAVVVATSDSLNGTFNRTDFTTTNNNKTEVSIATTSMDKYSSTATIPVQLTNSSRQTISAAPISSTANGISRSTSQPMPTVTSNNRLSSEVLNRSSTSLTSVRNYIGTTSPYAVSTNVSAVQTTNKRTEATTPATQFNG